MKKVRELEALRKEARRLAESVGLDPTPVIFGVVDYDQLNEYSAYDGFPERFPHWSFGMSYDYFRKRSAYSGWWTYELVLNTDPAIAFLRESNTPVENKGVMIHVYGHADFFKHNRWFSKTPKEMIKLMHTHAQRIEEYMNKHGVEKVESFMDKALSIQYEIDQYAPFIKRRWQDALENEEENKKEPRRIPVKRDYMERFVNPPAWLEERRTQLKSRQERQSKRLQEETELAKPQKDLLAFLARYGRLEHWQKDILSMIRDESLYFVPQMQTKIMNEGWAMLWQAKLMAEFAAPHEFIDHADMASKVLAGGVANPYALGKLIWEDMKERWDKGRFGREWELCQDPEKRKRWDTKANLGTEKIFEVRRNYNDVTFLAEFFTEELYEKLRLFTYEYIPETGAYHITSRDFADVKRKLLFQHTNLGRPMIKVATGNYGNKGELLLLHMYNGVGLNLEEAKEVLKNTYFMWGRPVNLKTIMRRKIKDPDPMRNRIHPERPLTAVYEDQGMLLRYDGESTRELALSADEVKDIRLDEDYSTVPQEWIG
ncbi:SpoVR family protein [Candidatus Acetothermia bacterium]|jgi:stage V sporulation protein R|nr:SpoVR family protein [Candidatus Acetothermia bacterium]MCI2431337.1 SpoVR family protein [Candidatus Acetothermia bacterium]MCI2436991.1 SpoVR family protein [Candidatus Acetothermia bacterium]